MRGKFILLAVLSMLVAGIGQNLWAATNATVGVCAGPGTHYTTITDAINAANITTGSSIHICPGIYPEQLFVYKAITLLGVKDGTNDAPIIIPPSGGVGVIGTDIYGNPVAAQIFVIATGGSVTIRGLTVDGTGNQLSGCVPQVFDGIYYKNTSGTIVENSVRNQYQTDYQDYGGCQNGLAINVESVFSTDTVAISYNSVRAYQKNGITASGSATPPSSTGPTVTIAHNYVVGLAATPMNWQGYFFNQATAGENGIQIGFGATGTVSSNVVNDNIWGQDTSSDPGDAASGILIYSSDGITVSGNTVGSAQFGIAIESDGQGYCGTQENPLSCGSADNTLVTNNRVMGTQIFDAIDLCSNGNTARGNVLFGSAQSAIHVDDTCSNSSFSLTSGNNNTVGSNNVNEACAGILTGTGSGNTIGTNVFFNVVNTTLAGDSCTEPTYGPEAAAKKKPAFRPSPFRPKRRKS